MIKRCDVAVVDLDQCIYPRFTQSRLGATLLAQAIHYRLNFSPTPEQLELARCLPRLLKGAAYIITHRIGQLAGRHVDNLTLMRTFGRIISGVPIKELEKAACLLPKKGPEGWKPALAPLARRMPVYLLTFSIDPVAREYGLFQLDSARIFSGWFGTPLLMGKGKIVGVQAEAGNFLPAEKLRRLKGLLTEYGYSRPLIIGHGHDEAAMVRMARRLGGSSIAIHRLGSNAREYDMVLGHGAWRSITRASLVK